MFVVFSHFGPCIFLFSIVEVQCRLGLLATFSSFWISVSSPFYLYLFSSFSLIRSIQSILCPCPIWHKVARFLVVRVLPVTIHCWSNIAQCPILQKSYGSTRNNLMPPTFSMLTSTGPHFCSILVRYGQYHKWVAVEALQALGGGRGAFSWEPS